MKLRHGLLSVRGLTVQVLLWTILPFTMLLILFSLTGISQHEASMHALATDENRSLVSALAIAVAERIENSALRARPSVDGIDVDSLYLDDLMQVDPSNHTLGLLSPDGNVRLIDGSASDEPIDTSWISSVVPGFTRAYFDESTGDVLASAPIPGTDLTLMLRKPWHSLTAPLLRFQEAMPFILFAAVLISLLTLYSGLRFVVRPLRSVGQQASLIGTGDFHAASQPVGGVKEIEDLRLNLNQMAVRLQGYQYALGDYLRAMTRTQEEERARLGRELHDETVQTLIALDHKAQMIQRVLDHNPTLASERLLELRGMTADAINEVRRFSYALRPLYLEELGLVSALELLVREADAGVKVVGQRRRLLPETELTLYRIAQEALNNARRHGQAAAVSVELHFNALNVILKVSDKGPGFTLPANFSLLTRDGHFGLMGMNERTQLAGGKLTVQTALGQGTTVTATIPIEAENLA